MMQLARPTHSGNAGLPVPRRITRRLLAVAAVAFALGGLAPASDLVPGSGVAGAIPPGGASPDTPGTSATVSPKSLRAGEVIRFTVRGFPAGETINVKIDDGLDCSASAVHGACVYHQQAVPSSGVVNGSFVVPADIAPGAHWLRFLASEPILDSSGNQIGVNGFTLRGASDFTVVAPGGGSGSANPTPGDPGSGNGGSGGDGSTGGGAGQGSGGSGGASTPGGAADSGSGSGSGDAGNDAGGDPGAGNSGPTGSTAPGATDGAPVTVDPGASDTSSPDEPDADEGADADADRAEGQQDEAAAAGAQAPVAAVGADGGGSDFPVVGAAALGLAVVGTAFALWRTRRPA